MDILAIVLLVIILGATFWLMRREKLLETERDRMIAFGAVGLAFLIRVFMMNHETDDYLIFLSQWVEHFRHNGGFPGLADVVGNYNLPYLYFLALFSYLPIDDLYLIKMLSICFDVILALGVSRVVYHYTKPKDLRLIAFCGVLLIPTVMLNGAYWAQCDSIFTAFAVWAFYYAIQKKGKLSMTFAALALAFKIQAIFFLPIYIVFLITKHIKLKEIFAFPVVYILTLIPAVLFGHPFSDALLAYFRQVGGAGSSLNYNSASIYAFLPHNYSADWLYYAGHAGIALALALIYAVIFWTIARKKDITDLTLFAFTVLLTIGIPFFLPHMHDRYFFMADIFTFMLALISTRIFLIFPLCLFGSLLGYHAYLKMEFLLTMNYGASAMFAAFMGAVLFAATTFNTPPKEEFFEEEAIEEI